MMLMQAHEIRREYNDRIRELNSDPTHPEYEKRCEKVKEEYRLKLKAIIWECLHPTK